VDVNIEEDTKYPFDGIVQLTVNPSKKVRFPLYLRVPGWCDKAHVTLNGVALDVESKPGSYLLLDRTWRKGDRLTLDLPMEVTLTTWTANNNSVSVNRGPLTFSVKIGENYVRFEPDRFKDPWPVWEIVPTTPWNYALDFDPAKLSESFQVVEKPWPADNMTFTHEGTPVEIRAKARKLPNWTEDHLGLVDKIQPSPVKSSEPVEIVTMIPMGAARLRLSALPVIGSGTDAHEWQLPPGPLASYMRDYESYETMFDGRVPRRSSSRRGGHFTSYQISGTPYLFVDIDLRCMAFFEHGTTCEGHRPRFSAPRYSAWQPPPTNVFLQQRLRGLSRLHGQVVQKPRGGGLGLLSHAEPRTSYLCAANGGRHAPRDR
jgi:hypothetical protein